MGRGGLLIGEVAQRSGLSRNALRLYEAAGILPAAGRTASGYRIYASEAVEIASLVRQARGLGFTLAEIKEIVAIKRTGGSPCPHVRDLVHRKLEELDRELSRLHGVRDGLGAMLRGWRRQKRVRAAVCPHIERAIAKEGRNEGDALHRL